MTAPKMNVIPFGKYKGQPVEVLQQDTNYAEWLMTQPWFKERFGATYTLVVNNFGEPAETPEHNALQAMFLDEGWLLRFAALLVHRWEFPDTLRRAVRRAVESATKAAEDAKESARQRREYAERPLGASPNKWEQESKVRDSKMALADDARAAGFTATADHLALMLKLSSVMVESADLRFELNGADVVFYLTAFAGEDTGSGRALDQRITAGRLVSVECKPMIADDYPAILRQMKANHSNVLFAREYTGRGATFEQVKKIFAGESIEIILESEVPAQ